MQTRLLARVAIATLAVCGTSDAVLAGSVTQPGETVGIAAGAPLPEGFYFVDTADWGQRNTSPEATSVGVNINTTDTEDPVSEWESFVNNAAGFDFTATPYAVCAGV